MRWLLKYAAFLPIAPRISGAQACTPEPYSGRTTFSSLSYNDAASPSSADDELLPIAQPVTPSMQPSIHQPSRMLKLGTPLNAAFMPLVPEASSGRNGVLS